MTKAEKIFNSVLKNYLNKEDLVEARYLGMELGYLCKKALANNLKKDVLLGGFDLNFYNESLNQLDIFNFPEDLWSKNIVNMDKYYEAWSTMELLKALDLKPYIVYKESNGFTDVEIRISRGLKAETAVELISLIRNYTGKDNRVTVYIFDIFKERFNKTIS